jgi:hypothetical protein
MKVKSNPAPNITAQETSKVDKTNKKAEIDSKKRTLGSESDGDEDKEVDSSQRRRRVWFCDVLAAELQGRPNCSRHIV